MRHHSVRAEGSQGARADQVAAGSPHVDAGGHLSEGDHAVHGVLAAEVHADQVRGLAIQGCQGVDVFGDGFTRGPGNAEGPRADDLEIVAGQECTEQTALRPV